MGSKENIERFIAHAFTKDRNIVVPQLKHGNKIAHIELMEDINKNHECDGLISSRTDVVLGVGNADCFSVFFIDEASKRFGVAHCGWKGIDAGLPGRMIVEMGKKGSKLPDIKVVIGPGIRQCHFEVQNDVWDKFYPPVELKRKLIDLSTFIKINLAKEGIKPEQIEDLNKCTFCEEKNYFSHRRDKVEPINKQISIIGLVA